MSGTATLPDVDIKSVKSALQQKVQFINEGINKGVKLDGANVEVSADDAKSIREALEEAQELKGIIEGYEFASKAQEWLDAPEKDVFDLAPEMRGTGPLGGKSLGEAFTSSEEFKSLLKSGGATMPTPYEVDLADLPTAGERKDIYSGSTGGTWYGNRPFGSVQFDPMVPRGTRTARVRDLFPVVGTTASLIDYFRVMGYVDGAGNPQTLSNAASVPERTADNTNFGLKPKSNLRFQSAQAPVRTIAHWEAAHRNVLQDEPALQGTINNELLYGLALEEDRQLLVGSGANEELLGVLNTAGIQTYTQANTGGATPAATESKADALRRAATLAIIANYPSTGYVLNPYDWEDVELSKDDQGRYILVTNVAVGATAQVWRQPVVETPAMTQGTWLNGAFGLGAQVYDRMLANVRIAEQHEDFFVRNAVAVLAEERIALAVKRPESFIRGTFI